MDDGFDSMATLEYISTDDLQCMGMKKGHQKVLIAKLKELYPSSEVSWVAVFVNASRLFEFIDLYIRIYVCVCE